MWTTTAAARLHCADNLRTCLLWGLLHRTNISADTPESRLINTCVLCMLVSSMDEGLCHHHDGKDDDDDGDDDGDDDDDDDDDDGDSLQSLVA